ncbi:putative transporter SVOPL [Leptinotarsa decemlineata]|uniref:putative transporter SVOPL n=1 Tax=Leptinotarsa decemlineata TaxID=7539 RepID=UPI000C251BBF|nr:synaptic vesicle glycoprotein 2B-like [Leptinotarsa decemlineata]XP_023020629.1 synaptic vesicle glycoprotein 2B-like [Leptinotarsa decemlineata]XP_023020630.1 synaptic vesicle glycoprotein 2B-like [Leptinotarsa decemlineata]
MERLEDQSVDERKIRYEHVPFDTSDDDFMGDIPPITNPSFRGADDGSHLESGRSSPSVSVPEPASFEEAIAATGFGKYNIFLMFVTIFPSVAEIFEVVALSYVLPIAECDLNLTLSDKGMLNAMTFAGMVTSALFWGRLCDMIGRKSIIKYGYIVGGGFAIIVSLSTNITVLSIAKFCGGFIINGPYSASVSHLSEFHSSKYRARVQIVRGATLSSAYIFLPLLAWGILPQKLDFSPFGLIDYHSWNVFLFICAIPTITSGLIYFFVPESPKFLMTLGRNEEALNIFRKVYRINTGNAEDTFPINCLVKETYYEVADITQKQRPNILKEGISQMKPFMSSPHINRILLICCNAFLLTMSMNLVKLWLPQIFQATSDHQISESKNETDVCSIFEELRTPNLTVAEGCTVNLDNMSVYINSIIVGITGVISFSLAGTLVNLLGKKTLTVVFSFAAGCFCCAVYFSTNSLTMMILYSLDLSLGCIADNVLTTTTLELFPTTLRTSALCLHLMFGRFGTVVGNIILPQLLQIGCAPPIFFLGFLVFGSLLLTVLYPSTENKPLL